MLSRNVRRSLYDHVTSLLTSPPAGTFGTAFNVYTEANLRNSSFAPTRPFVYLVDRNIAPTVAKLPLVIVEMVTSARLPYEVGNRSGHVWSSDLNIFGDSRGTRDDLSSFFQDNLGLTFAVKNYGTSGSPTIDTAEIMGEPVVETVSVGEEAGLEGALANFDVVSFDFITLT